MAFNYKGSLNSRQMRFKSWHTVPKLSNKITQPFLFNKETELVDSWSDFNKQEQRLKQIKEASGRSKRLAWKLLNRC